MGMKVTTLLTLRYIARKIILSHSVCQPIRLICFSP
ncbi:hypothetical protein CCHR01_19967 [Colletotrichum chrysophilum]|uniref:Uncharacterized protein n=1 Tax=Colletotrichum chrysophilum TaxID=1836956 RepID=A0AAD9A1J6_9PEZI|nr:hypothetical protein CCHR01_19967 [Colletotrichum chrysophilum]